MSLSSRKILITGCSRGLGLGLAMTFLDQGCTVIATCRNPSTATDLTKLKSRFSEHLHIYPLDIISKDSHISLRKYLQDSNINELDVIIANAGISNHIHPHDPAIACSVEDMTEVFQTNVIGTMLTFQTYYDMLNDGKLLVAVTSVLGSLATAHSEEASDMTSYRASKAALNSFALSFSADPQIVDIGIKVICLHPGWVQTELGNADGRIASLTIEESCNGISDLVSRAILIQESGKKRKHGFDDSFASHQCVFVDYKGKPISW